MAPLLIPSLAHGRSGAETYLSYAWVPFFLGLTLLAIEVFGQELNSGMFSTLLASPIARPRLWRLKVRLLFTATGILSALFAASVVIATMFFAQKGVLYWLHTVISTDSVHFTTEGDLMLQLAAVSLLTIVCALSGGLWTTLLLRQAGAAFWFTLCLPLALSFLTIKLCLGLLGPEPTLGWMGVTLSAEVVAVLVTCLVLLAYGLGGYLWAKRLFLRAQDLQWSGGAFTLRPLKWGPARADSGLLRQYRPMRALIWKEWQGLQASLILAVGMAALHLLAILFQKFASSFVLAHPGLNFALDSLPVVWLAIPIVVGSVSIAEERKTGTLETQLCLPARRWRQFAFKLLLTLLAGVLLGGFLPVAIEWAGARLLQQPAMDWEGAKTFFLPAVGLTLLAFYSSSLARNTLQAMTVAVLLGLVGFAAMAWTWRGITLDTVPPVVLCSAPTFRAFVIPVAVIVMIALACLNFGQLRVGWRVIVRDFVVLAVGAGLAVAASAMTYNRVWELWMSTEPPHSGQAWVNRDRAAKTVFAAPGSAKLRATRFRIASVTPGGGIWARSCPSEMRTNTAGFPFRVQAGPWTSGYIAGSNWSQVEISETRGFALQSDGTLWDISVCLSNLTQELQPELFDPGPWKHIVVSEECFAGLKSDGTLWEWGTRIDGFTPPRWGEVPSPVQVGIDSHWIALASSIHNTVAMKKDQSLWAWGLVVQKDTDSKKAGTTYRTIYTNAPVSLGGMPFPGVGPVLMKTAGSMVVSVLCSDGSVWLRGVPAIDPGYSQGWSKVDDGINRVQTEWLYPIGLLSLDNFGRLSFWDFQFGDDQKLEVSEFQDWLAVSGYGNEFFALARDGSLCRFSPPQRSLERPSVDAFLAPSRIKARLIADVW